MKVLMLGWEFPPHISGGLGTACQGLTRGLSHTDVETLFLVPRSYGDEEAPWMQLLGANQVSHLARREFEESRGTAQAPTMDGPGPGRAARPVSTSERPGRTTWLSALGDEPATTDRVRVLEVDSPLTPYLDARQYAERLEKLARDPEGRRLLGHEGAPDGDSSRAPADVEGWLELSLRIGDAIRSGVRFEEETFEMWGGYGAGLFDEVARFAMAAARVAVEQDFDLVHAHDWITYPAGVAAARAKGVPLVVHLHATEFDRTGDNPDGRVSAIERMGLLAADRVVCVSHYTSRIAERRYGVDRKRLRVLHNAVTQKEQREEWHTERTIADPIVLFLGRITLQKGPEYFLEAAAKVVRERPRTRFVISGSGDMLPGIVMRAARMGLTNNLFFTGFLRGKDVERMYAMADLYVMPSVSEPFGITPLEAMALDVPVIVSRQSGVSEILSHALKVDFWDTDELANKMLAVLEYAPLRSELVDSGREEVRRIRWELRGDVLRDYYAELLEPAIPPTVAS